MALLELGARKFTLPQGEVLLGADPQCAIPLSGPGVLPRHAKLKGLSDGQVVISKAVPEAEVLINGVRLGAEPTPLLHGDKVEVAGQELTFVDERRSGSTQYVQAMSVPQAMAQAKAEAKGGKATTNTGGRVVSLTDGREYAIAWRLARSDSVATPPVTSWYLGRMCLAVMPRSCRPPRDICSSTRVRMAHQ